MAGPYRVTVWHGENGSIAQVVDIRDPDSCLGYYSTIRDGIDWRTGAQRQADALNKAVRKARGE